jgi:hypothetical protein
MVTAAFNAVYPSEPEMKKPLSEDLGLTGQHRADTNDDFKPSLRGSCVRQTPERHFR